MATTIRDLRNALIKSGMNPKSADALAKKHNAYLNRVYKDATIKQKADIARTLGMSEKRWA